MKTFHGIGLISGTSADGIDAALVEIAEKPLRVLLKAFQVYPYSPSLQNHLAGSFHPKTFLYKIGQLHMEIGEEFSQAALRLLKENQFSPDQVEWIGSHGQTIYHSPPSAVSEQETPFTLQLGDGSLIAERTGILTVSDFRAADIAQGGEGAPLVPYVDRQLFSHPEKSRVLLNIGGIANFTYLPAKDKTEEVRACDTGPGNVLLNYLTRCLTGGKRKYDNEGKMAARGSVNPQLLENWMRHLFISHPLPKSADHEYFGKIFAETIWQNNKTEKPEDLLATATAFTAESIALHISQYAGGVEEILVSGGGVMNLTLMKFLDQALEKRLGGKVERIPFETLGIPAKAKEAVAFAFLAYETLQGKPSNLPQITGAKKPCILGKISPGWRKTWKLL